MHRDRRTHLHCDLAAIALVVAGLALVAGCGDQRRPQTPGAENPQRGGTFTMSQDSPETLDPARVDDVYEATLVNQIFNGLLAYDSHLNTVPCIASRISRRGSQRGWSSGDRPAANRGEHRL